jgi:hypothetical protein
MSIIERIPASVQADPGIHEDGLDHFAPSAEDLAEYSAYLASRSDLEVQAVEPTPVELLEAPADPEDLDDDGEPWWASLPECPELDTPISLPEPATIKVRNVRGERFYVDTHGDPGVVSDGYVLRDRQLHNAAIRRFRWYVDARRFADDLNACEPRSRASNWNPEADQIA